MTVTTPAPAATPEMATTGLTGAEAKARLAADGRNELATAKRRSPVRIVLDVLREPMLVLLLVGGVVYREVAG